MNKKEYNLYITAIIIDKQIIKSVHHKPVHHLISKGLKFDQ